MAFKEWFYGTVHMLYEMKLLKSVDTLRLIPNKYNEYLFCVCKSFIL